jgi:hypothetical protein
LRNPSGAQAHPASNRPPQEGEKARVGIDLSLTPLPDQLGKMVRSLHHVLLLANKHPRAI